MKIFFILLLAVITLHTGNALADFDSCSNAVIADRSRASDIVKLRSLEGKFQVGRCQIEMHLCKQPPAAQKSNPSDLAIGDVLVSDDKGNSIYVPLYDIHKSAGGVGMFWSMTEASFEYRLTDVNMRLSTGMREVNYLAMDFDDDGKIIDLEASHYNRDEYSKFLWLFKIGKFIHCGPYLDLMEESGWPE